MLGAHARRLHGAFVLDGLDVYGVSVFVALDDVGPASQRGLLTGKLVSKLGNVTTPVLVGFIASVKTQWRR